MEHIDFRKVLPDSDIVCQKCGGIYLVDISNEGDPILVCDNCGDIKDE